MAVKINGKLRGEDPQEQFKLEKRRFTNKMKRKCFKFNRKDLVNEKQSKLET